MTTINNYDTCSTMPDCELTCVRDGETSRIAWEETFELIETRGRNDGYYFYINYGNEEKPDSPSDCFDFSKCNRRDFRKYCLGQTAYDEKENPYGNTARETIETMLQDFGNWKDYAVELIDELSFSEYMQDGFPTIEKAVVSFKTASIQGYSRGDFATVLYRLDTSYDQSGLETLFTHLFFDAPIRCFIEVDGKEYDLSEDLKDVYDWGPDEIKEKAKAYGLPESVLNWLSEKLPEYPEYAE